MSSVAQKLVIVRDEMVQDVEEVTVVEVDVADVAEPAARPEELRLLEALLFAAGEPLDEATLGARLPEGVNLRDALKALHHKVVSEADYVGDKFAEEARKIHFKDVEARGIYGEATHDEVSALIEDGVDFMPLPNLPEEHN